MPKVLSDLFEELGTAMFFTRSSYFSLPFLTALKRIKIVLEFIIPQTACHQPQLSFGWPPAIFGYPHPNKLLVAHEKCDILPFLCSHRLGTEIPLD